MSRIFTENGWKSLGGFAERVHAENVEKHAAVAKARQTFRKTLSLVKSAVTLEEHKDAHALVMAAGTELTAANHRLLGVR